MIKKILSLILLLIAGRAICVPVLGGDIQYTYQGNGMYKITAKMYRDCRGLPFTSISGLAYAGSSGSQSCGTQTLTFTRVAINNVSQFCSTATNPCKLTNQTDGEGVEEHIYETTVDVTKTPYSTWIANGCCDLSFAAGACCRNPASNNLGGDNLWVKCSMNVCNLSKTKFNYNSSPVFSNIPIVYACCSSPYIYNQGSIDTTDFDSISYKLVSGLTSLPNGTGTYNSPYSAKYPMKPYCIPTSSVSCTSNPNAKPPRGFYLDSTNGSLVFTPMKCDELGFVVIEVNEYRKDTSGNWVIVGNSRRDMQIVVKDDCGYNYAPKVSGPFSNKVCEGDKICFTVKSTDETFVPNQTIPDTTLLTWNHGIPGTRCSFTVTNPSAREKEAEFCWQTQVGDAKEVAYYFTATANDQNCPRPKLTTRVFSIKVVPKATATSSFSVLSCGQLAVKSTAIAGIVGTPKVKWSIKDSNKKEVLYSIKQIDTLKMPFGGKFYIYQTINNAANCATLYVDSLVFPQTALISNYSADITVCARESVTLNAPTILNVKTPLTYKWTRPTHFVTGDVNSTVLIKNLSRDSTILCTVTDGDGCKYTDYTNIKVNQLPKVTMPVLPSKCIRDLDFDLQEISGIVPNKSDRSKGVFKIVGKRNPSSIQNIFYSSTVIDNSILDKFTFKISNINEAMIQGTANYNEKIYLSFTDSNGCTNVDSSRTQIVYGNPIIEFLPTSVCQDMTEFKCADFVKRPKPNPTTMNFSFAALSKTGTQVKLGDVLVDKNIGMGNPDYWFQFGTSGQTDYIGKYGIEYCVANKLTLCRTCDTTEVIVVGKDPVSHTNPADVYTNSSLLDVLTSFSVNGKPAVWGMADTMKIVGFNFTNSIPSAAKISNGHYFDPAASEGIYTFKYINLQQCGTVADTVNLKVLKSTANHISKNTEIKNLFSIQPNPNDGKFAVILSDKAIAVDKILILDLTGKAIESISKPIDLSTGIEINSTKLSAGIYFLQLQSENKVYRQKFVVAN